MRPYASYDAVFFSAEKRAQPSAFDGYFEHQVACFHEAGHAVTGYILGLGLTEVLVTIEHRMEGWTFSGRATPAKRAITNSARTIARQGYGPFALKRAVTTCAGPAAEYRYRIENGMPLRLLWATIGDHEQIDAIARLLESAGRDRYAFRRLAMREAENLIWRDDIWDAVSELATFLQDEREWPEEIGSTTVAIPGPRARAIIRRIVKPLAMPRNAGAGESVAGSARSVGTRP